MCLSYKLGTSKAHHLGRNKIQTNNRSLSGIDISPKLVPSAVSGVPGAKARPTPAKF